MIPINDLTLLYINKKPIDFKSIADIIFVCVFSIMSISYTFTGITHGNYIFALFSFIILIIFSFLFSKVIISNFIKNKKGMCDYIGHNNDYIQLRLPEGEYYFSIKVEESISISNIKKLELQAYEYRSWRNLPFTSKTEIGIIFYLHNNKKIKEFTLNLYSNEINPFIERIEQFAHSRNIPIQSFRS